jgi:ribosomal protein L11 methyltransferase
MGNWDLVVANILSSVIVKLLDEGLAEAAKPGGTLVLSGILEAQVEEVKQAAQRSGLKIVEQRQMEEWVALVATK